VNDIDWLLKMPNKVLFGQAKGIERWLSQNGKARPTLLDLDIARRIKKEKR
jgi:hypothetical protein